jgi:DNA-binding MarR family transcriptional regulator
MSDLRADPPAAGPANRPVTGQDTEITLGVLDAVEQNATVTQRSVARELGIALGLANSYLKRCVRKGLIKVKQIPPNRYLYYLTPKGFSEKSRLTGEYLASSFTFFRRARAQMEEAMAQCRRHGWRRVALLGAGELAEIASLCNAEHGLDLVVVAAGHGGGRVAGLAAVADIAAALPVDALIVTDHARAQHAYAEAARHLPVERILTPRLLRVVRKPR